MGSSPSKAARKFPTRSAASAVSQTTRPARAPKPSDQQPMQQHAAANPDLTAADPDFTPAGFARRLQQMGVVDPNPTYSPSSRAQHLGGVPSSAAGPVFPSSRANVTLSALASRRRVQERADADTERFQQVGLRGADRRYVDMRTLADALRLLDAGVPPREVEARMGMQEGLLHRLGRKGVLTHLAN
ncbi:hypothetical protein A9K55_003389 [Cordyceps militaris]|uniref:Helix-turn-helix domain-containing protein n=1 Tax=Cordyceps militaris TaxID=73501 RepID=A0A2H4S8N7_CORMI|nr:hypothetical protein A9K55_003389 [Cordyceps militaris]